MIQFHCKQINNLTVVLPLAPNAHVSKLGIILFGRLTNGRSNKYYRPAGLYLNVLLHLHSSPTLHSGFVLSTQKTDNTPSNKAEIILGLN
jgi:hypothetical protein